MPHAHAISHLTATVVVLAVVLQMYAKHLRDERVARHLGILLSVERIEEGLA